MSKISEQIIELKRLRAYISCQDWEYAKVWIPVVNRAIDIIETLSAKVRANNLHSGWIPCSERLPEKPEIGFDGYIVQTRRVVQPFVGYWDGRKWTDEEDDVVDEVIAWMPLPETYKGECEDA